MENTIITKNPVKAVMYHLLSKIHTQVAAPSSFLCPMGLGNSLRFVVVLPSVPPCCANGCFFSSAEAKLASCQLEE